MASITDSLVCTRRRTLADTDPAVAGVLRDETTRQNTGLELIASENVVSPAIRAALALDS